MYSLLFRTVLTRLDPEDAHHLAFAVIRRLPWLGLGRVLRRFTAPDPSLAVDALGVRFPSPFGIAAGFDKEGLAVDGLTDLGFGHVEIGTITALAQPGNEKPRLFRLVSDRALINRMGFNNTGADSAAARLAKRSRRSRNAVLGINIGKSRVTALENATQDYARTARVLSAFADYLVINVSSPNTPGLRGLQELDTLKPLVEAVTAEASGKPLLVKIAPDLDDEQVRGISKLAVELGLDGIIATNTTISRAGLRTSAAEVEKMGVGGLSGAPLADRSLAILAIIREEVPAEMCVISVGGVDTAEDVQQRIDAGATLVQGYSAFIYRGPAWAARINRDLVALRATR